MEETSSLVVFDGDDTLWSSEELYDLARMKTAEVVADAGLDPLRWSELQRGRDLINVKVLGLDRSRFPTSAVEAYATLARLHGEEPDPGTAEKVWATAADVFSMKAPLVEGAQKVLESLCENFRLVLLTQGDYEVQQRRVEESGLSDYFTEVFIVKQKTTEEFQRLLNQWEVSPSAAWSVGNSLPSDINPALSCGMSAIWIDVHVWDYERRETVALPGRLYPVRRLTDVPRMLREAVPFALDYE